MVAIVAVAIFNIITFSSNTGEIPQEFTSQRALPAGCYQWSLEFDDEMSPK